MFSLGAHIHRGTIMAPKSLVQPNLKFIQVVSPAVSPIYNNNSGYAMLTLTSAPVKMKDFKCRFFNLPDYHMFGTYVFSETSMKDQVGDINDVEKIRAADTSLLYNL